MPEETGIISGNVYFDDADCLVSGAMIEFISSNQTWEITHTDEWGNYSAELPVGEYIVSVFYADSINMSWYQEFYDDVHSIAEATPVSVLADQETGNIDFGIPFSGISGDATVSGTVTDNEANALENALVTLWSRGNPAYGDSLLFTTTTDENGDYSITIPTSGNASDVFIASAQKDGFIIECWEEKAAAHLADPIYLNGDNNITDINFTLSPEGSSSENSISGIVSYDSSNLAIENAFVIGFNIENRHLVFAFTNSEGQYVLEDLIQGMPYYLLFAAEGCIPEFYDNAYMWEDAIAVTADGEVTGIDAALLSMTNSNFNGGIAGTVIDNSGAPLSGVLMTIKDNSGDIVGYDFS
ncbi:MAG: carboxypeptidase regulatory-like domain-containing protein, partial [Candidatus Heimdallarchaeota archaeon]|nr:carboxypeptidase regulatory-like domain-containing protein [Candidatus Heimdallarchaeota archaeon]